MAGEGTRYDITEVKAIRGTESRTIASKQQAGWELITQEDGRLRTTMTFRRPKPKTPKRLWAALGCGVVVAGLIGVGALLEDDSDSSTTEAGAPVNVEQPAPQPAQEQGTEPFSSTDPMICETRPGGDPCRFGQTAIYGGNARSGGTGLEITVGEPVEFEPSETAVLSYDRPTQPVSVYFPVTIKNARPAALSSWIHTQAKNAEQKYSGPEPLSDGDIDAFASGVEGLPAWEARSVKEGWTMATLDGVEFDLKIDGMAGYTITFTR